MAAYGIRQFRYSDAANTPTALVIELLVHDGTSWQVLLRLPGEAVTHLRALLQDVEAENPGLTGENDGRIARTQVAQMVLPGKKDPSTN